MKDPRGCAFVALILLLVSVITPMPCAAQATGDAFCSAPFDDFAGASGDAFASRSVIENPYLKGLGKFNSSNFYYYRGASYPECYPPNMADYFGGIDHADYDTERFTSGDGFGSSLAFKSFLESVTWSEKRMPLRLYFSSNIANARKGIVRKLMLEAFQEWTRASDGRATFVVTNDFKQADMVVCRALTSDMEWAEIVTDTHKGHIDSVSIHFTDEALDPGEISDARLKAVCLHEVGHALGISDHSDFPLDAMSTSSCNEINPTTRLTAHDRSMLMQVYSGATGRRHLLSASD